MWKIAAFIGTNIVTSQIFWEEIWMSCVVECTRLMQCKIYDTMLELSPNLQAARVQMVFSIVVGIAGIPIALVSGKCTNFIVEEQGKVKASIAARVVLNISRLLLYVLSLCSGLLSL